ncbi:MAG: hypothetical protein AAF191_10925, partial [Verrucomicrobiota bacterium]
MNRSTIPLILVYLTFAVVIHALGLRQMGGPQLVSREEPWISPEDPMLWTQREPFGQMQLVLPQDEESRDWANRLLAQPWVEWASVDFRASSRPDWMDPRAMDDLEESLEEFPYQAWMRLGPDAPGGSPAETAASALARVAKVSKGVSWEFQLSVDGTKATIRGTLPEGERERGLRRAIQHWGADRSFESAIRVEQRAAPMPDEWWRELEDLIQESVGRLETLECSVSAERLSLAGVARAGTAKVVMPHGSLLPPLELELRPRPLQEPTLRVAQRGMVRVGAGTLGSPEELDLVRSLQSEPEEPWDIQVDPGVSLAPWVMGFPALWRQIHAGVEGLDFEVAGKVVTVQGRASASGEMEVIQEIIQDHFGPEFRYDWKQLRADAKASYSLQIAREGRQLLLTGMVKDIEDRAKIEGAISRENRDVIIQNRLVVASELEEVDWVTKFPRWWKLLKEEVPEPVLRWEGSSCVIRGMAFSNTSEQLLREEWRRLFEGEWFLVSRLELPQVGKPTLFLQTGGRSASGGGSLTVAGRVGSSKERRQVRTVLQRLQPRERLVEDIKVVEGVGSLPWLADLSFWWPELRRLVPEVSLTLSGNDPL